MRKWILCVVLVCWAVTAYAQQARNLDPNAAQDQQVEAACKLTSDGMYRRGAAFGELDCEKYWQALWWTGKPTVAYICWALDTCSGREFPPKPSPGKFTSVAPTQLAPEAEPLSPPAASEPQGEE